MVWSGAEDLGDEVSDLSKWKLVDGEGGQTHRLKVPGGISIELSLPEAQLSPSPWPSCRNEPARKHGRKDDSQNQCLALENMMPA